VGGADQLADKAVGRVLGVDIDAGPGIALFNQPYLLSLKRRYQQLAGYQLLIMV